VYHLDPVGPQQAEELSLLLNNLVAEDRPGLRVLREDLCVDVRPEVGHRKVDGVERVVGDDLPQRGKLVLHVDHDYSHPP
jgi:hypothetical protein